MIDVMGFVYVAILIAFVLFLILWLVVVVIKTKIVGGILPFVFLSVIFILEVFFILRESMEFLFWKDVAIFAIFAWMISIILKRKMEDKRK